MTLTLIIWLLPFFYLIKSYFWPVNPILFIIFIINEQNLRIFLLNSNLFFNRSKWHWLWSLKYDLDLDLYIFESQQILTKCLKNLFFYRKIIKFCSLIMKIIKIIACTGQNDLDFDLENMTLKFTFLSHNRFWLSVSKNIFLSKNH